jgi:hypothetical protein
VLVANTHKRALRRRPSRESGWFGVSSAAFQEDFSRSRHRRLQTVAARNVPFLILLAVLSSAGFGGFSAGFQGSTQAATS